MIEYLPEPVPRPKRVAPQDARDIVRARLEGLTVPEPITSDMCEAAIAAAVARTIGRLAGQSFVNG